MKITIAILIAATALAQAQEESAYEKWKRQSDAYIAWSEASTDRIRQQNAEHRQRDAETANAQAIAELKDKLRRETIDLENQQRQDAINLQNQINAIRLQK